MSKESLQFLEMVRRAAAENRTAVRHYCQACGGERPHRIKEIGAWEIWTCLRCGCQARYKVR